MRYAVHVIVDGKPDTNPDVLPERYDAWLFMIGLMYAFAAECTDRTEKGQWLRFVDAVQKDPNAHYIKLQRRGTTCVIEIKEVL